MHLASKIILSLTATILLLFAGFVAAVIVAFGGGSVFRQVMAFAFFTVVWLFSIAQIWKLLKPKIRYFCLAAAVGLIVIAVAGNEIYKMYDDSIDQVNDQGVDLSLYDPFREDTLTVSLDEASTLTLTDSLPRLDGATALYPVYAAFAKAVYPSDIMMRAIPQADIQVKGGDDGGGGGDSGGDGGGGDKGVDGDGDNGNGTGKGSGNGTLLAKPMKPEMAVPEKPGDDDVLACTNTDGSFRRLVAGQADIIFIAKPSNGQRQMASDAGLELRLTPIGREAFVFFVNAKNPVRGLSVGDIRRIYSGEADNWREFGGKNSKIRAFQRPENSGSQTALIGFMGDTPLMTPPKNDIAGAMGDIISMVSSYKNYENAIGYSFLFYATEMVKNNKIKLLELNGIAPTRESVADGTYPYAAEFYAVTAGTSNPNADKLIEWILSGQGQELIEKTGYTPLR